MYRFVLEMDLMYLLEFNGKFSFCLLLIKETNLIKILSWTTCCLHNLSFLLFLNDNECFCVVYFMDQFCQKLNYFSDYCLRVEISQSSHSFDFCCCFLAELGNLVILEPLKAINLIQQVREDICLLYKNNIS